MYVCMCMGVTEAQVRACVRAGAHTVEEVSERSAAGTGCGGCLDSVEMIVADGGPVGRSPLSGAMSLGA